MPIVYAVIIIAVFGLIYVLNQSNKNELYDKPVSELNPYTKELLDDPNYQYIILPDELDAKIAGGEPTFIYFFASNCPHCRETTPVLMPIADELGIDLPQFNLLEFRSYYNKYAIEFTPTLSYFEDGKEVARRVGGVGAGGYTAEELRAFMQNPKGDGASAS